jgi:hypothetical protein
MVKMYSSEGLRATSGISTDGSIVQLDGSREWLNSDKKLHRDDGPAIVGVHGEEFWYQFGKLHRIDGPAITNNDGIEEWHFEGEYHRVDGPAVTHPDGHEEWWVNGELHRTDGPAMVFADGREEWWVNGELHRTDGPAMVGVHGDVEWFFYGVREEVELYREALLINLDLSDRKEKEKFYNAPISQLESIVHAFNGWKKS